MKHVYVIKEPDKLHQEKWEFIYLDNRHVLVLTHYFKMERPTPRHKFSVVDSWDGYKNSKYARTKMDDVPLPDDVQTDAISQFMADLKITKMGD